MDVEDLAAKAIKNSESTRDLIAALYDCGLAAHSAMELQRQKKQGVKEKLEYIKRRASNALIDFGDKGSLIEKDNQR